jgi:hypothetical protein
MTKDRGPEIVAVVAVFFVLTWTFVGLRVYSRAFITRSFGVDDKATVALQVRLLRRPVVL